MDIEKHVQIELSVSRPIKIQKTYKNKDFLGETITNFELKQNFFDPNKGSPPSSWTFRLLERIEKYCDNDVIKERN